MRVTRSSTDSGSTVRLADIARVAGVSSATVSYALTGVNGVSAPTRQRILRIARRLGYVANRHAAALRSRRSLLLGVLVTDIKNPFFAEIVSGIESAASANQYRVMLCVTRDGSVDEARHLQMLLEHNVDGLIIVPVACDPEGTYRNVRLLKAFQRRQIPIQCIVDGIRGLRTGRILTDVYKGTRLVVEHLIGLGHRHIAYFSQPFVKVRKGGRHAGYYDALQAFGVPARPELMIEAGLTPRDAYERTRWFVRRKIFFTAAVYPNDYMAVGGLRALRESGLNVPRDVSVTGFDDVEWARYCEVPLTTVRFPARELGERCVMELMRYIHADQDPDRTMCDIVLPPTLVVRESTAPPPGVAQS